MGARIGGEDVRENRGEMQFLCKVMGKMGGRKASKTGQRSGKRGEVQFLCKVIAVREASEEGCNFCVR